MSMISISVTVIITLMITLATSLLSTQSSLATKGTIAASQLDVVSSALSAYVSANASTLVANGSISIGSGTTTVANILSPTLDELKAMSLLPASVASQPSVGGAYNIALTVPSACASNLVTCQIGQLVYYTQPFLLGNSSLNVDVHVLGSAVASSASKRVGYAPPSDPSNIVGPGWKVSNPVTTVIGGATVPQSGLLAAFNTYAFNASLSYSYFWKSPVQTVSALPVSSNTTGDVRFVIGVNTPYYWDGAHWLAVNSTSSSTVTLGASASNLGTGNTNLGANAGLNSLATVTNNTNVGFASGNNSSGSNNTVVGANSGGSASGTNQNNTILGYSSANNLAGSSNLTLIGSGIGVTAGVSNSIALGNTLTVAQSNTAYLGPSSITSLVTYANYVTASDRRLKSHITDSLYGLEFINQLKPVEYAMKSNGSRQVGFIAQEVEEVAPHYPGIVKPGLANSYYALTYTTFIPSLVKAVQELDRKVQLLKTTRPLTRDLEEAPVLGPFSSVALLAMSGVMLLLMVLTNVYTFLQLKTQKT
jgi:Chaperone of endosialidase